MPWLAPQQLKVCQSLAQRVGVISIPTLLIVSPEGKLMTPNGVACLRKDPEGKEFPWEGQTQPARSFGVWVPLLALFVIYYLFRFYFEGKKKSPCCEHDEHDEH